MKVSAMAGCLAMLSLVWAPARAKEPVAPPAITRAVGVTLLTQNDPTTHLIGIELSVPAGLDRQSPTQNGLAALVAECILQTPVALGSGELVPLTSMVTDEGGAVSYAVESREVRFYLEGLTQTYSAALLPALRHALSNPDFRERAVKAAHAALRERAEQSGADPLHVGMEMLGGAFSTQAQLGSDDARAFYAAHYRRDGSVVSAIGDLATLRINDLQSLASTLSPGASRAVLVRPTTLSGASRKLVAHRDFSVPWLVAQYRAPAITSRDYGAMLVLSAFLARTLSEVAAVPSVSTSDDTRPSGGVMYNFGTRPASLIVFIGGGLGDPARAFARTLAAARVVERAGLQADISDLKAGAFGFFAAGTNSMEERARLAATFTLLGTSPDYWGRTSAAISATTAADLQRVAQRYLVSPTVALILPRAAPVPQ